MPEDNGPAMDETLELEVVLAGRTVNRVKIGPGGLTLGRASSNDVVLADSRVSKQHARLSFRDSRLLITDLDSACGTLLAGARVQEAPLTAGVEAQIGPFVLRLVSRETVQFSGLVGVTDLQAVLETLLDRSLRLVGARTGFVLLAQGEQLAPVVARQGPDTDERFSRTICQQAMTRREPVDRSCRRIWRN